MAGPQGEGTEMRGTQSRGGPKVDLGMARGRGGGRLVGHAQAVVFPLSVKGNHVELGTEGGQKFTPGFREKHCQRGQGPEEAGSLLKG